MPVKQSHINSLLMEPLYPEEVLHEISVDLKKRRLTHADAAMKLGFGSKQTLSNILSFHKYLSKKHADKFVEAFGYSYRFLTTGVGDLYPHEQDYVPEEFVMTDDTTIDKPYTVLNWTEEGDKDVILNWIRRILAKLGNEEALAIYPEIYRFAHARSIAKNSMEGYRGENPYELEFTDRYTKLQSQISTNIETMIDNLK